MHLFFFSRIKLCQFFKVTSIFSTAATRQVMFPLVKTKNKIDVLNSGNQLVFYMYVAWYDKIQCGRHVLLTFNKNISSYHNWNTVANFFLLWIFWNSSSSSLHIYIEIEFIVLVCLKYFTILRFSMIMIFVKICLWLYKQIHIETGTLNIISNFTSPC